MRTLHNLHTIDIAVDEIGVTVRRGTKWADVKAGDRIELCVCTKEPETHQVAGIGEVVEVYSGKFSEIPARTIELEHEETSRAYPGLLFSMRRAYGPEFSQDEEVVVMTYRRVTKIK